MGISGSQFWQSSKNGKAMLLFLAQRGKNGGAGDVEVVRDVCEWLVEQRYFGLKKDALSRGATEKQAIASGKARIAELQTAVHRINDANVSSVATAVVDAVFVDHMRAGHAAWEKIMAWFADRLREKVVNDVNDT